MAPEHPQGFDDALGASYRLVSKLGEGASGEVWRTEHRPTGDTVATKLLRPEHLADSVLVRRFFEERDVLKSLRHPGVVAVRDLVAEGDRLAIVMEYVDGGSLGDVLRSRGPLPPALAADVTAAILDGLAAAHEKGVVHRDIKPDNVLLTREWWSLRPGDVKLVDFGIAQILTESSSGMTGGLTGTPEFMAPELVSRGIAGRPADLYGVGILLYQLLAGRTPFAGPGNAYTIAHRHIGSEPPPLELPMGLHQVLESLLVKNPDARPDAVAAAQALRRVRPELTGLPALPRQEVPAEFSDAQAAVTQLRSPGDTGSGSLDGSTSRPRTGSGFATGGSSQDTTLRPLLGAPPSAPPPAPPTPAAPARRAARPGWQDPRVIAAIAASVVVVAAAVLFVVLRPGGGPSADATDGVVNRTGDPVTSRSPEVTVLPTGLGVSRTATYDPVAGTMQLVVSYSAQGAPLTGPFLQILPGATDPDDCPVDVLWRTEAGSGAETNTPSETGISTRCGWSVDVGTIDVRSTRSATVTFPFLLEGADTQAALDTWLARAEESTDDSLADPTLMGDAYPVQRLVGIAISATSRTVSGSTIPLTFYPQWAGGGPASTDPIYRSPLEGDQSQVLTAVAGPDAVRLSENCSGQIVVRDNIATARGASSQNCSISARVGAFSDLSSNSIQITTSGS